MKLIHVHGFSEAGQESLITSQYKKYADKLRWKIDIQEFKWNALSGNPTKIVANFKESENRVKKAASQLADRLNSEKQDVVISGYSLGGAIVLEALELYPNIPNLHSVILFGAAYPQKNALQCISKAKPKYYALNYHSPRWDIVLSTAYYNATGCTAIGSSGFTNPQIFQNLKVNCTHSQRTGYSRIVDGVVGLLAHAEGLHHYERAKNYWMPYAVGKTGDWDDIFKVDDEYIIQRNCITTTFRVIESGGIHKKLLQSKSILPLLDAVENMPK